MRKSKAKKAGGTGSKKGEAATPAPATDDAPPSPATAEPTVPDAPEKQEPEQQDEEKPAEEAPEDAVTELKPTSPSSTPSLSAQSKARSTSFRQGSISLPLSPGVGPGAGLGLFSPEGETAPDIYRKHVLRIEELERENKTLAKDAADAARRWQKAEGELADLREAEGAAGEEGGELAKLVRPPPSTQPPTTHPSLLTPLVSNRKTNSQP